MNQLDLEYREEKLYWIVAVFGPGDYKTWSSPSSAVGFLGSYDRKPQALLMGVIECNNLAAMRPNTANADAWRPGVYSLNSIDMDRLRLIAKREDALIIHTAS